MLLTLHYNTLAYTLAKLAHTEPNAKSGEDKFSHVLRVSQRVKHVEDIPVALLHDIIEDSPFTAHDLRYLAQFPKDIVDDVVLLSRVKPKGGTPTVTYMQYIENICQCGRQRPIRVKIADVEDHLARKHKLKDSHIKRYTKAMKLLKRELV